MEEEAVGVWKGKEGRLPEMEEVGRVAGEGVVVKEERSSVMVCGAFLGGRWYCSYHPKYHTWYCFATNNHSKHKYGYGYHTHT